MADKTNALAPSMTIDEMVQPDDLENDDSLASPVRFNIGQRAEFEDEDKGYAMLRVAQQGTQEVVNKEAQIGQLVLNGFPAVDSLTCVVLSYAKTRMYAVGNGSLRRTLCKALDAHHGVGTPGGECKLCPLSKWTPQAHDATKNDPPKCDIHHNYILLIQEYGLPVQFSMKKTGIKTAQTLNQLIEARGEGGFVFRLNSKPKSSAASSVPYSVPQISVVMDTDSDTPNGIAMRMFLDTAQRMINRGVNTTLVVDEAE